MSSNRINAWIRLFVLAMMVMGGVQVASAQGFYQLSEEELTVKDRLPWWNETVPLGRHYADSIYDVKVEYPEYIPMTDTEIRRYHELTADTLPCVPMVRQRLGVARKEGFLCVSVLPFVCRDGQCQKLVSFKLVIEAKAVTDSKAKGRTTAARVAASAADRYTANSVLRSGTWAKIRVPSSGVYQLTDALCRRAGFSDPAKVKIYGYGGAIQPEKLTADYLTSTDDLHEVATCRVNGRRLFHAQGPVSWNSSNKRVRNPYSDYGYYFLTESDDDPLTADSADFVGSFYPSADDHNTLYEVDDYAWYHSGRNLYDSQQFGQGVSHDYHLSSPSRSGSGRITFVLSMDAANVSATVSLNDSVVGTVTSSTPSHASEYAKAVIVSRSYFVKNLSADNKVTIRQTTGGTLLLDHISIYSNDAAAPPDLANASFPEPEYVYRITNQNHHADSQVDMVIIIPTSQWCLQQAQRLKALHEQHDHLSVNIVPADELYNEFSSGTPDATAYRRYMKMLYDRAENESQMPKYLVLFGDGAWDNRMLSTAWKGYSPDDFLLCNEAENSWNAVDSYVAEDFFTLLDDEEELYSQMDANNFYVTGVYGMPDVAVGRFPVRTAVQANVMIDKLEQYMSNQNAGAWRNTVVVMGDDGDENGHMKDAERVAEIIEDNHPDIDLRRVMWDAYQVETSATGNTYPEVTKLLRQYMNSGALVMNYSGHGRADQLSHERVLTVSDFEASKTKNLPFWITASCDIMPFDGQENNIGEAALFNEKGGAVAFFGTTRTVYQSYNGPINRWVMTYLLSTDDNGNRTSVGEAIRKAKVQLATPRYSSNGRVSYDDNTLNKLHFVLMGDPALVLASPLMKARVDSINGQKAESVQTLAAGTKVRIAGSVTNGNEVDTSFHGVLTAMVKGAEEIVACRNNAHADTAFKYRDRISTVYKGMDSVRAGRFTFDFVVPKDIRYNDGSGLVILYAVSDDKSRQAHGSDEVIAFNGTGTLAVDSVGPSVFCYLNTPSFINGDVVNSTPYFVAEVNDENGINASGTGVGHDLQIVIDGQMTKTYSLNDYFSFDFGSYQSGTVGYSIPQLSEGEHRLQFRVWDILNNSTTTELRFRVENAVDPQLFDIECTKNPARTSTSFRVIHDRIGSEVDIILEIFDMSGRMLYTRHVTDEATSDSSTIDWDLCVDGGAQVGTGVYLYRIKIASEGSNYVSKAKKLVVLSNK